LKQDVLASLLDQDYAKISKTIERFISSYIAKSPANGLMIGLSGGLDSAVALKLGINALGAENVACFILPSEATPENDTRDAIGLASLLDVEHDIIDISPIIEKYLELLPHSTDKIMGNLAARIRMGILYHHASVKNYLVAGTGDKSEFHIGYFTKFGDGGSDIMPLADVYKTQVRALAQHLGIPAAIVEKKSSPGLWKGQTAEGELGMTYEVIDPILHLLVDRKMNAKDAAKRLDVPLKHVSKVQNMIRASAHKRRIAEIAYVK
jgi:NAD+ synthase